MFLAVPEAASAKPRTGCGELVRLVRPARAECAARVVVLGQAQEQRVERLPLLGVERCEERLLDLLDQPAESRKLALALGRDADDVAPAILGIALPFDEAPLLERVEQGDEPAGIE